MSRYAQEEDYEYAGRLIKVIRAVVTFEPNKPFGGSEVASKVGLPINTTIRLLRALVYHKFLIRETVDEKKFFRVK